MSFNEFADDGKPSIHLVERSWITYPTVSPLRDDA